MLVVPQSFEHATYKTLSTSSDTLDRMAKEDLNTIIARNLKRFMAAPGCLYPNANALSVATNGKVSPGTIRNLREPEKRTTMPERTEGYPRIDTLETVASLLGREVWELLHPDLDRSTKERELYAQVMGLVSADATPAAPLTVHESEPAAVAPIPRGQSTRRKKRA